MAPFPVGPIVFLLGLFGDSLIANGNWPLDATPVFETLGVRMQVDNQALAGQGNNGSYATAQTSIPILAATVIPGLEERFGFWKYWSINGSSSPVLASDLQRDYDNYVQQFIDLCSANGMVTILETHTPSARIATSGVDDVRKSYNDQVRAKAAADVLIFDADSFLTDGGSPARLIPAYSLDGTHYTTAGMDVLANQLGIMLKNYYIANFR